MYAVSRDGLANTFPRIYDSWHKPSLGVKQMFPWIWEWKLYTLRNQIVPVKPTDMSVDTSKQQTSLRISKCYISSHPDKNQSSRKQLQYKGEPRTKSLENLNQVSHSRTLDKKAVVVQQNGGSLRQSLIVSCCNWLWLRETVKEGVNKSNHPIQNPLLLVMEP
jgi:hypothetical protein